MNAEKKEEKQVYVSPAWFGLGFVAMWLIFILVLFLSCVSTPKMPTCEEFVFEHKVAMSKVGCKLDTYQILSSDTVAGLTHLLFIYDCGASIQALVFIDEVDVKNLELAKKGIPQIGRCMRNDDKPISLFQPPLHKKLLPDKVLN